ncbi:hypothetical protein GCM10007977_017690 [Dactylosporangium sucinum]|uniref:Uncharacterized protein n=1 Tax=Dactylosporangium sucinum TaxID=1424081 RepID=A0A917WN96_9ACTN|nr:hypothetical protein GCM10007977_017690 [Dactylosporangium sucinum]
MLRALCMPGQCVCCALRARAVRVLRGLFACSALGAGASGSDPVRRGCSAGLPAPLGALGCRASVVVVPGRPPTP